ncbi:MFS transporter [Curtobacterium sp. MCBD17_032]|uniref:MFS transporter n=1 Tax=Curtobacterium sp. MCBD17_032 TaxID=2175659 RepID=UPI000DAAC5F5|nr:MFS transporter [Curtobacterium sp. MCBD17_032]PZE82137.1 MFS transporter [Curtobacterium sp. MCBD17_032]
MRLGVVTVLCLVQFVDVLGVTSVVTAIPAILDGLGADPAAAGPLATTYAMFFAAMLILGARLGDRYGHREVLLIGVVVFGLVSIIGGTAEALPQVLVARAVQGAAAAVSAPSALRLILHATAPGSVRARALAAWSAVGAAAGATGFLIGGLLTTMLGWPSVFWVNAPVAALLFIAIVTVVREQPEPSRSARLDVLGAVLLVAAVMPVIAGTALLEARATQPQGVGLILLGMAGAGLLVWRLRRARHPLVPPGTFRSSNLRRGSVQSFVNTATTSSSSVLATLVLQDRLGIPALLSGLVLMAFSLAVIGGAVVTGRFAPRLGQDRLAAAGAVTIACGNVVLAVLGDSCPWIAAAVAVIGFGLAAASVAATGLGTSVPATLAGSAAGIVNTGAQLGTAIGTAVVILIATAASPPMGWAFSAATAFLCAGWCRLRGQADTER